MLLPQYFMILVDFWHESVDFHVYCATWSHWGSHGVAGGEGDSPIYVNIREISGFGPTTPSPSVALSGRGVFLG